MTAHLFDASVAAGFEAIEELAVVKLLHGTDVDALGYLPAGSLGAIVFVHNEGEAYEVEFAEPFAAVMTLRGEALKATGLGT